MLVATSCCNMQIGRRIRGIFKQSGKRPDRDRVALCRFHNTVYLGCVIGTLVGIQICHAAIAWPTRALRRLSSDLVRRAVTRGGDQMRLEHVDATKHVGVP
jgi:hypothetical protein